MDSFLVGILSEIKKLDCVAPAGTGVVKPVDRLRLPHPSPVAINNELIKLREKAVLQGTRQI